MLTEKKFLSIKYKHNKKRAKKVGFVGIHSHRKGLAVAKMRKPLLSTRIIDGIKLLNKPKCLKYIINVQEIEAYNNIESLVMKNIPIYTKESGTERGVITKKYPDGRKEHIRYDSNFSEIVVRIL